MAAMCCCCRWKSCWARSIWPISTSYPPPPMGDSSLSSRNPWYAGCAGPQAGAPQWSLPDGRARAGLVVVPVLLVLVGEVVPVTLLASLGPTAGAASLSGATGAPGRTGPGTALGTGGPLGSRTLRGRATATAAGAVELGHAVLAGAGGAPDRRATRATRHSGGGATGAHHAGRAATAGRAQGRLAVGDDGAQPAPQTAGQARQAALARAGAAAQDAAHGAAAGEHAAETGRPGQPGATPGHAAHAGRQRDVAARDDAAHGAVGGGHEVTARVGGPEGRHDLGDGLVAALGVPARAGHVMVGARRAG